jgi:hypothetical protein
MLPLILVLTSRPASADCVIFGMRPTVALPTMASGQEFSFLASPDCETLRFSIPGTGLSWRPKRGGPAGPGPSTYRVVLTDEEWDQVVALSGSSLTWVVIGTASDGTVTRVSTTNDVEVAVTRDLATADATVLGDRDRAWTGSALAPAGDVDGDGQMDVLIGAPYGTAGTGVTYLISGPVTGTSSVSEASTRFLGAQEREWAGISVAGAGDVDGDGYDDVLIGAPGHSELGRPGVGAAYLVLGPVTGSFDLSLADATFVGPEVNDHAGESVASAGDMDGDGLPDLLVGAPSTWAGDDWYTGAAYVMSGTRRGTQGLGTADAKMYGELWYDNLGNSVDGVGDVNGDGLDDILIAAFVTDDNGYNSGTSYVVFGPVDGRLDPSNADAKLVGEVADDYAGKSTASAGDVDADGLPDILIGATYNDENAERCGAAYLVHGGVTGTLWLGDADAKLYGENAFDEVGISVAGAGDVDADGHDDLVVGSAGNDEAGDVAGAAYLVRGPVAGSIDLWRADLELVGAHARDLAGWAVSGAGDLDHDGRADVLVGAPGSSEGATRGGAAYVLYGSGL